MTSSGKTGITDLHHAGLSDYLKSPDLSFVLNVNSRHPVLYTRPYCATLAY